MSIDEVVQQAADAKSTQWNPDRLIELLVRTEQGARAMAAARYRVLSALAGHSLYQDPLQDTATEAACALRIFEHAAQAQAAEAQILTRVLPETLDALATGTVQVTQVRAPIEHTSILDATTTRTLQASVLPKMPTQNPAATRKALSRAVLHADPQGAADRRATAVKNRQVVHHPQPDGISTPAATPPTEQAIHAMNAIDTHARTTQTHDHPGKRHTPDQARADAFHHLLTGTTTHPATLIQDTVPLDTLLHLSDEPGELAGYGPLDPHTVRTLAAREDTLRQRLLTTPETSTVVQAEPTRYRPTPAVRRLVSARDRHCTFPTWGTLTRRTRTWTTSPPSTTDNPTTTD